MRKRHRGRALRPTSSPGIYAAIAHDVYSAAQGVEHDQMNVLCLGSRVIGTAVGETLVEAFINAVPLQEERYRMRLEKSKTHRIG